MAASKQKSLSPRQQLFARTYVACLSVKKACTEIGMSCSQGHQYLYTPKYRHIQEFISSLIAQRNKDLGISAELIAKEFAKIAFANVTDVVHVRNRIAKDSDGNFLDEEITDVHITDTRFWPAHTKAAVKAIEKTKNGIKVIFHDKTKALEVLARHTGMLVDDGNARTETHIVVLPGKEDDPEAWLRKAEALRAKQKSAR